MFPYYLLPGNKPKPKLKPKKSSSYLPSYLTVYVKPDPPPARAGIPDDILAFVNPNPKPASQPKRTQYDPLSSIQAPKRGSGNNRSSSSPVSQSEKTVRIRVGENPGPREIIPDKSLPDIADVPGGGIDPADLKFYFAARDHDLVRSVEAALTHEGLPARYYTEPSTYVRDNFAEFGMDDEADAAAVEYTRKYAEEMSLQRAQKVTQEVIEDLANDETESVVAVDRDTGEIVFVRYGDEDSVTLQEEQRKLAEGRNIILIHNHPKSAAASLADLGAADWLDAERLVIVTPSGKRYYYHRRGGRLVALKPVQGPGVVAAVDPEEAAVARLLHMMQSAREAGNPAEWVMEQGDQVVIDITDGTPIYLPPLDVESLGVSQTLAEHLWEHIIERYGGNVPQIDSMQYLNAELELTLAWHAFSQTEDSGERAIAYELRNRLLEGADGIQNQIEFFDAAGIVNYIMSIGGENWGNIQYLNVAEFGHDPINFDAVNSEFNRVGMALMDHNDPILATVLESNDKLPSPYYNSPDEMSSPTAQFVDTAVDWDIHMVWREQGEVGELIEGVDKAVIGMITRLLTLEAPTIADPTVKAASEAIGWAVNAVRDSLNEDSLNFATKEHRIAIGVAMMLQKRGYDEDEFKAYYSAMMASVKEQAGQEVFTLPTVKEVLGQDN